MSKSPFDDLETLGDIQPKPGEHVVKYDTDDIFTQYEKKGFVEQCPHCGGTGVFRGYSGRVVGRCFKCKGEGSRSFKTSPEHRAKQRKAAIDHRERTRSEWADSELGKFLRDAGEWSEFALSLNAQGETRGLTDPQRAAAESMMAKVKARQAERDATRDAEPDSGIDLTELPAGRYAVPGGDTRLKVLVNKPGKQSKWDGYIFVSDAGEYGSRTNYGRQVPNGGLYKGKIQDALRAILEDPKAAAIAYGKLTGTCGMCGRLLENAESIAAGIGPVCAGKF